MRGPDEAPKICTVLFVHSIKKNDHWTEIRLLLININNFKQRVSVQWSFFLNEKQKRTGQKKGTLQKNATKKCKSRMVSADVGVPKWHWTMPCLKHTLVVQCFGLKLPKNVMSSKKSNKKQKTYKKRVPFFVNPC